MFRLFKVNLLVLLALMLIAFPAQATVIATMGDPDTSGNYEIEVDSDEYITIYGGLKTKYEAAVTNDTIVATETGRTYSIELAATAGTDTVTMVLPTAAAGLEFSFLVSDDITVYIDPAVADTIYLPGCTVCMDAGDKLASPGATGDSITLISPAALKWVVKSMYGTWTDGGSAD